MKTAAVFRLGLIAGAALLSACSTVNPYQHAPALDSDLKPIDASQGQHAWGSLADYAPEVREALSALHQQRLEWLDSMSAHARVKAYSTLGVYGTTAYAFYRGAKPGAMEEAQATGTKNAVLKAGVLGALAYSVGNFFVNDKHDQTYIEGYKALSCSIARARPELLSRADFDRLTTLASNTPQSDNLAQRIEALDELVLKARHELKLPRGSKIVSADATALNEAERALGSARRTLEEANKLRQRIATKGFELRRQGDLIFSVVGEELRRNNHDIVAPGEFFKQLQDVNAKVQPIAPVKESEGDSSGGGQAEPSKTANPDAVLAEKEENVKRLEGELTAAQAKPQKAKTADKGAAGKAGEKPGAGNELDLLEKQLAKARDERDIAKKRSEPTANLGAKGDEAGIVVRTAKLYAKRRELNQFLVNHYDLAQRVKAIPECVPGGTAGVTILPGEDITVQQGESYRFHVSGSKGIPTVSLNGNPGRIEGNPRNPVVSLEGGTVVIELMIGKDAPAGELKLLVTDGQSQTSDQVKLTVPPPLPKQRATEPDGPASSPKS